MSTNPPSFSWVKVQHLSQFLPYNLLGCPCLCRVKSYFSENLTLFTFAGPCHGGENYLRWPRISTLDWRLTASTRPTKSSPLILFASGQPTFSTCHFQHFPLCSTFNPAPYPHNSPAMLSNSLSPYFSEKKMVQMETPAPIALKPTGHLHLSQAVPLSEERGPHPSVLGHMASCLPKTLQYPL